MMNNLYDSKSKGNTGTSGGKSNAGEAIDISSDESGDDENIAANGKISNKCM